MFRLSFRAFTLVFIHHKSRRVWISPPCFSPHDEWVCQQAKNALMWMEDENIKLTHLIIDNDTCFTEKFDSIFKQHTGNRRAVARTSIKQPKMNAFCESFIGHMKAECHNLLWFFRSIEQLCRANYEYMKYHNSYRPHQSKENKVLDPDFVYPEPVGAIKKRTQLNGVLTSYYREAA